MPLWMIFCPDPAIECTALPIQGAHGPGMVRELVWSGNFVDGQGKMVCVIRVA